MRFWSGLAVMAWSVSMLAGCGGSSGGSKTAQLRLLNASVGYPSLDMSVNAVVQNAAVAYGAVGSYAGVTTDAFTNAVAVAGSTNALTSASRSLTKDTNYTLVAYGWQGALKTALIQENVAAAAANQASLQVLNLAVDAGSVDVYLTGSTDALTAASPVATSVPAGGGSVYNAVGVGTFRLRVTGAGDKNDLRLDVPGFTLSSTQVAVLLLTPGVASGTAVATGGVLVSGIGLLQAGASTAFANTSSRVRLVAGLTGSATVGATLGGTDLLSGIAPVVSPGAFNGYVQLPASASAALTLTVNGTPLTMVGQSLAAGADYSLLVWGTSASPKLSLIADDNRLPTASGVSKMRLVNAMSGAPLGQLSLIGDQGVLAATVAQGTASAYFPNLIASGTPTANFQVYSSSTRMENLSLKTVLPKGVYTFYMFGDTADSTTWFPLIHPDR